MEWQPIETAPRDGTPILIYDDGMIEVVTWMEAEPTILGDGSKTWAGADAGPGYQNTYEDATHWMRLPEPPAK